jgi:hypothetical protein
MSVGKQKWTCSIDISMSHLLQHTLVLYFLPKNSSIASSFPGTNSHHRKIYNPQATSCLLVIHTYIQGKSEIHYNNSTKSTGTLLNFIIEGWNIFTNVIKKVSTKEARLWIMRVNNKCFYSASRLLLMSTHRQN